MERQPKKYCYTRYSTIKQDITRQFSAIDDYLARTNETREDYIFFSDEGISGGSLISERKTKEILKDLQKGDFILVVEMSRFSRNNVDRINFIDHCDKIGVTIFDISSNSNVTMLGADEGLLAMFNSWQDASYLTKLSKQTIQGMQGARKNGKLFGTANPKYAGGDKDKLNKLRQSNARKASLTRTTATINSAEFQERLNIFKHYLPRLNELPIEKWDKKMLHPSMYEQIFEHINKFCSHWLDNKPKSRLEIGSLFSRTINTYQKYSSLKLNK